MSFEVRGLDFRRPGFEMSVPALTIEAERLTAIVGPNGAGKTTLLKCLAGLLPVPAGSVRLDGAVLASLSDPARARRLAFVPQEQASAFNYAVRDFILMGRAPYLGLFASPSAADEARAAEALTFVGLPEYAERPFFDMSSGERRLILIARALAQATPILILDEPTTFLDPRHESGVMLLLRRLVDERGQTVLVTLHNLDMAARYADALIFMKDGMIVAQGPPGAVLSEELLRRVYDIPMRIIEHEGRTFIVR
ncbi:MAG: ABC transporter ATP-binding protein [Candidatus Aminicenantes bacterium]|nr:ABC transporter ATP-binding protein [Candidatus Aminicenantes bacterium]